MTQLDDKEDKKKDYLSSLNEPNEEEGGKTGGEGGQGGTGSTGEIVFRYRDPYAAQPRDDVLSPNELKRLIKVHHELHKTRVDKQKLTRKERAALKEGRKYQVGGTGQYFDNRFASKYKTHPISLKAQFSGIDKQITGIPNDYDAETNLENREALENRFQLRNMPRFNPKPRPM